MDRKRRRDESPGRDDKRSHRPRYEQDRSRSPPRHDRRDDRRRDRTPPRGPTRSYPHPRDDRGRDNYRGRDPPPPAGPRAGLGSRPSAPRDVAGDRNGGGPTARSAAGATAGRTQAEVKMEVVDPDEDSEAEMQRIMGFKGFRSTKNTKVPGNDRNYAVHKVKKVEYRQYMNRVGGFNRPLSPSRG